MQSTFTPEHRPIAVWLMSVYIMVFVIVLIGGVTRLTGSGLSMVDWAPLMGVLPPLSDAAWEETFRAYQASPQFEQVNHWMDVEDFKGIFFWEYFHRLFARLIGVVFFVPWLVFLLRGRLKGTLATKTTIAFLLGGLQGGVGWLMVKSGLVNVPAVSHLRLAAHLSLAFLVGGFLLWITLDLARASRDETDAASHVPLSAGLRRASWVLVALICVEVVYGAFMSGTRAGALYRTFPDMNGEWIPVGFLVLEPAWKNFLDNPIAIHAVHRLLAYTLLAAIIAFYVAARRVARARHERVVLDLLLAATLVQAALGAATVMLGVPIGLAVAHQGGAFVLLSLSLAAAHAIGLRSR